MKTTIDFPPELLHHAKVTAALRQTTLRELVIEGLSLITQETQEAAPQMSQEAKINQLLKAMKASNTEAMQPLSREQAHER